VLLIHIQQDGVFIIDLNLKSVSRCVSHYGCGRADLSASACNLHNKSRSHVWYI